MMIRTTQATAEARSQQRGPESGHRLVCRGLYPFHVTEWKLPTVFSAFPNED